jgi:uncharacterized protein (DUF111 family)
MREYATHTNYLRVLLGEVEAGSGSVAGNGLPLIKEDLLLITAEIDDMPAELMGAALESLMLAGALDCHFVPIQMKKNRPGVSLHVLANHERVNDLLPIIFKQTTTFGVKVLPIERFSLTRRWESVDTDFGPVAIKLGTWDDAIIRRSPEFEDCRVLAHKAGVPVMEVYHAAVGAAAAIESPKGDARS